jgi:outer membrane protein OmpA-like peptidoglycan-associated protein
VLSTLVVSVTISAQERGKFTDCRKQACSVEALEQALFPEAAPQGKIYRGLDPQRRQEQSVQVQPLQEPVAVGLNVFFEFNSDQIVSQYRTELDKVGKVLARHPEGRFHIEGHTDSIGSDAYNQALSEKRAESVKRYLVQHFSIPPERLVTQGYGKNQPRTTNNTDEGRGINRRVELVRK